MKEEYYTEEECEGFIQDYGICIAGKMLYSNSRQHLVEMGFIPAGFKAILTTYAGYAGHIEFMKANGLKIGDIYTVKQARIGRSSSTYTFEEIPGEWNSSSFKPFIEPFKSTDSTVDYVDHMGSDLTVVNAARVSFNKKKEVFEEEDVKLIRYLAKHEHWSPFAHTSVQLKLSAPIFIARQLVKHQVGGVWNEVSRRYVSDEPSFFIPEKWRGKPINSKQGSSDEIIKGIDISEHMQNSLNLYNDLLAKGVAPEMARMVLPQNMMTEWYWTGSLVFWARVCKLRLDGHAQAENYAIAKEISRICGELFPVAWAELIK